MSRTTRWKLPFSTIDPNDPSEPWEVGISEARYRKICNHGHEKAHARMVLIHEVLSDPVAIRRGWDRQGKKEGCYVYIGKPRDDYHKLNPTICVPAPPGMVFLVFVLESGEIDDWVWRKHADGDITKPIGVEGDVVWFLNQS